MCHPDGRRQRQSQLPGQTDELDLQIQKIKLETEATTYSMKTAAENELKLWDSELNNIYNDLLNYLDENRPGTGGAEKVDRRRDGAVTAKNSAGGTLRDWSTQPPGRVHKTAGLCAGRHV
ncbi:MAG: lysozyme inhibitor LprI family protein [Hungatella hathewayi]